MASILDYLAWRGDISFEYAHFNEVDNLVFSELAYFNFNEVFADTDVRSMTLTEAFHRYQELENPTRYPFNNPIPMLTACADTVRFGQVRVSHFIDHTDSRDQIQFVAVTFDLGREGWYIAFRGTDNQIVGWREDCNFSYMEESPAQSEAVNYLNHALTELRGPVWVGGHSKGGNLAIFAAAFCMDLFRSQIVKVYSNDGPGFNEFIINNPNYRNILPKVRLIVPEASLIGIILLNDAKKHIIKSSGKDGLHQHSPYTWLVKRDRFELAEKQSSGAILLDETLDRWLAVLNSNQKMAFVSTVFDILEASGSDTLDELNSRKWISYNAILKAAAAQSSSSKENFMYTIKQLAIIGGDVLWDETLKRFTPFIPNY